MKQFLITETLATKIFNYLGTCPTAEVLELYLGIQQMPLYTPVDAAPAVPTPAQTASLPPSAT